MLLSKIFTINFTALKCKPITQQNYFIDCLQNEDTSTYVDTSTGIQYVKSGNHYTLINT